MRPALVFNILPIAHLLATVAAAQAEWQPLATLDEQATYTTVTIENALTLTLAFASTSHLPPLSVEPSTLITPSILAGPSSAAPSVTSSPIDGRRTVYPYSGSDAVSCCSDFVSLLDGNKDRKVGLALPETLVMPLCQPSEVQRSVQLMISTTGDASTSPWVVHPTIQRRTLTSPSTSISLASLAPKDDAGCTDSNIDMDSSSAIDSATKATSALTDVSLTLTGLTDSVSMEKATVTTTMTTTIFVVPPWSNSTAFSVFSSGQNNTANIFNTSPTVSVSTTEKSLCTAWPLDSRTSYMPSFSNLSLTTSSALGEIASTSKSTASPLSSSGVVPEARYRGFNFVNQSPFKSPYLWKNAQDWNDSFRLLKAMPGDYNAIRLYSTTDSDGDGIVNHLLNALPAARDHSLSVHVGVWSGGDAHTARFAQEKAALDEALTQLGCNDIVAVSVGNEDMYSRHRTDGQIAPLADVMLLVNQTQEVMDVLDDHGCCDTKITHTDTFGDWLDVSFSEPLLRQVDFLTINIFPYWQNATIDAAGDMFWRQLNQTRDLAASYGKDIWLGETGWPLRVDPMNQFTAATPGVFQQFRYWQEVGCPLMNTMNAFWYVQWDDSRANPSFGVLDNEGNIVIGNMSCN